MAAAYWGSVTARRASECVRMYSISSAVATGLVGTMTVPVLAAAIQKRRNSGQLPRCRLNLSPCRRPHASNRWATRLTSASNSRQVQRAVVPVASSKMRKGSSGKRRALSSSAPPSVRFPTISIAGSEKPLGDDLFHHLGGARGDGPEPHVAEEALHGKLPHVAVAAVELDRLVRDPVGHLGAEELGHGDLGDAVPPGIVEPRRAVHQMPRGLDLRGHLRHPMSQGLLLAQRAAEGVALLDVCPGVLERLASARECL